MDGMESTRDGREAGAVGTGPGADSTDETPRGSAESAAQAERGRELADRDQPAPLAGDWRTGLPASWRERFQGIATPEEALRVVERGLRYRPAERPEDIVLRMPEGATGSVDAAVQDHFRRFCVDQGITPGQAQALLEWQFQTEREGRERFLEEGTRTLRQAWGSRFEEKREQALTAFMALDRRMGGSLALSPSGRFMASDPVMVQVFQEIGSLLSEDSLAGGSGQIGVQRESAEDTYRHMFKE